MTEDTTVPVYSPKRRKERKLEQYLIKECKRLGVYRRKLKFPGVDGAPDQLIGFCTSDNSQRYPCLVELKDGDDGVVTAQQEKEHNILRRMGFHVYVITSEEGVDRILARYAHEESDS